MIPIEVQINVPDWKEQYSRIYYLNFDSVAVVFRRLKYKEYKEFLELAQKQGMGFPSPVFIAAQERLFNKSVLWSNKKVGQFTWAQVHHVLKCVIRFSAWEYHGFVETYMHWREFVDNDSDSKLTMFVCRAFPSLKPKDLQDWDVDVLLHHVTMAEDILGTRLFGEQGVSRRESQTRYTSPEAVRKLAGSNTVPKRVRSARTQTAPMDARMPDYIPSIDIEAPPEMTANGTIDFSKENSILGRI